MRRGFVVLGALALLIGAVWTLQGADILMGSFMTGSSLWLAMGLVLVVAGAGAAIFGLRSSGPQDVA